MKYAHYNETNGKILGWFDDSIHGTFVPGTEDIVDEEGNIIEEGKPSSYDITNIPTPNVEVTEEGWQKAIDSKYNFINLEDKSFEYKDIRTLDEAKKQKINKINAACKTEIISGFESDALGSTHIYQSELTDQLNLIGVVTANEDDYFKCGVVSEDGNIVWDYELHTVKQLKQVLQNGKAHKATILQKASTLKASIENATSLDELENIVWS